MSTTTSDPGTACIKCFIMVFRKVVPGRSGFNFCKSVFSVESTEKLNFKKIAKFYEHPKSRATSAHKKHVATCMNIISPVNFKLIGVVVISAIIEGTN